jgi:hypothetical protein
MNSLDRSLLEKAGNDNGWERIGRGEGGEVLLSSSRHGFSAKVWDGGNGGEWLVDFNTAFPVGELKRSFPEAMFHGSQARPWDLQTLGVLLRRAAELGLCTPETPLAIFQEKADAAIRDEGIARGTEAERLVRQRVGQDCYRNAHMEYWGRACAVTGVDIPELLRASHAKPWAECSSDSDRLNVYNGFLLSANIDALFDKGLVSFSDEGAMLLSQKIAPHRFKAAGIGPDMSLRWIDAKHLPFLRWHREHLFGEGSQIL